MELIDRVRDGLSPRYDVGDQIGRGGSSIVLRAVDTQRRCTVAVKVLLQDWWSGVRPERFQREVRIAGRLKHPNILPLLDSGEVDGLPFYTMPFVEGRSLRDLLREERQLDLTKAVELVVQVARALQYAHGEGFVHRDIKPENILLDDGRPIVADFGVARALDHAADTYETSAGHAPGTPTYMSPEHGGASDVDGRSDVYSLGCVLYEALGGEPPFTGNSVQAVIAKHMFEGPPDVTVIRSSVPPSVSEVLRRALAKSPADRFQTAEHFASALERSLQVSSDQWRRRRALRKSARYALPLALLLGIAVGAGFWLRPPELSPAKVVVFPLVLVQAGGVDESGRGWDVALALEMALEHTEPLRWIDGWGRLSPEMRHDVSQLTPELARRISMDQGAGRYVDGVIRTTGDSVAVTLRLHDAASDVVLARETAWGAVGEPLHQLGLAAVVPLLTRLVDPGRSVDLTPLTDRAPAAVALAIQGDRAYRSSAFGEAFEFYRRAVSEDSLLSIAAARGAVAGAWVKEEAALGLARHAVETAHLLPPHYRVFARGVEAYLSGRADEAVAALDSAIALEPGWLEPAVLVGEVHYHLFPTGSRGEADAARAWREVSAADSTFLPALPHLAEIAIRSGAWEDAQRLIGRMASAGPEARAEVRRLRLMLQCVQEEDAPADAWEADVASDPGGVLSAGHQLAVGGARPRCAEQAFHALLAQGGPRDNRYWWSAMVGLQSVLLAQGRVDETVALLDSALTAGYRDVYTLYLFDAPLSGAFDDGSRRAEALTRRAFGDRYRGLPAVNLWLLGVWLAETGQVTAAQGVADELAHAPPGATPALARQLTESVLAHIDLAEDSTSRGIRRLSQLQTRATLWSVFWKLAEPLALERIQLARALLGSGDPEQALAVAEVFDHPGPMAFVAYLGPSLAIRMQAAEKLGQRERARTYRERLIRLGWEGGDVPLSLDRTHLFSP